jgi:hypothetical protein
VGFTTIFNQFVVFFVNPFRSKNVRSIVIRFYQFIGKKDSIELNIEEPRNGLSLLRYKDASYYSTNSLPDTFFHLNDDMESDMNR